MKDIIIAPVITEKAANINAEGKTYVFKVKKDANKHQIKEAIESAFNVTVTDIRTLKTKELEDIQERQKLIRKQSLL